MVKAAAPGPYHDIAAEIGAQNAGTRLGNPTHDVGMEMSVAVPRADRDHCEVCTRSNADVDVFDP